MRHFHSVLIANRGEIACRIIRTLRDMGLRSVAVYSDADADAPHVRLADQALPIGPSPAAQSYLVAETLIAAAKASGALGPSPDAIATMGDKAVAKRRMIEAGVPCVPGYQGGAQDDATLTAQAKAIGFPLMVKAAAGGGGRGMRLVHNSKALPAALADARSEALSAFGSDALILERAVLQARHVEVPYYRQSCARLWARLPSRRRAVSITSERARWNSCWTATEISIFWK